MIIKSTPGYQLIWAATYAAHYIECRNAKEAAIVATKAVDDLQAYANVGHTQSVAQAYAKEIMTDD